MPARQSKQTGEQGVFGRLAELSCSTAKLAMLLFLVGYLLRTGLLESFQSGTRVRVRVKRRCTRQRCGVLGSHVRGVQAGVPSVRRVQEHVIFVQHPFIAILLA